MTLNVTLTGLSLFFKSFPFLNTGISVAPPFTLSTQTWLLFWHGVLLLPPWLPGLESPQALCRTNSNTVFSLFWLQLGQTKWPHYMGNVSGTHRIACARSLNPQIVWDTPLKFPHTHYLGQTAFFGHLHSVDVPTHVKSLPSSCRFATLFLHRKVHYK